MIPPQRTVIKAHEAGPVLRRLSTVDLADHLVEARAALEAGQRRAAQIAADAERMREEMLRETQEAGYKAGYERGLAEGTDRGRQEAYDESIRQFEQRHAGFVSAMQQAVAALESMKDDLQLAARQDLLDFAVRIASKLTFAVGKLYRESAVENLRRALRLVESRTDLAIHMHPDDVATAREFADTLLQQADASRVISIVPDQSVAPGGCLVQTAAGQVDATLTTQIDELVSLLLSGKPADG